jgi:hypothetical protein
MDRIRYAEGFGVRQFCLHLTRSWFSPLGVVDSNAFPVGKGQAEASPSPLSR